MLRYGRSTCIYAFFYFLIVWVSGANMLNWISYGFPLSFLSAFLDVIMERGLCSDFIRSIRKYFIVFDWNYFFWHVLVKVIIALGIAFLWRYLREGEEGLWQYFILIFGVILVNVDTFYKVTFEIHSPEEVDELTIRFGKALYRLEEKEGCVTFIASYRTIRNINRMIESVRKR